MPREQILVDARLVVEAVEIAGRDQVDQVPIALLVLAEQDQVVVAVGVALDSDAPAARRTPRSR